MRSCIHVGFIGGSGNRHRRTKSAEKRHVSDKSPKRITWNFKGDVPNNSPSTTVTISHEQNSTNQERQLPPTPNVTISASPCIIDYDPRHLSPRRLPQHSYSTPSSPTVPRKLPPTPVYQNTCLPPKYRF